MFLNIKPAYSKISRKFTQIPRITIYIKCDFFTDRNRYLTKKIY